MKGMVKWFDDARGYGFITPEFGGKDRFVHYSAVQMQGHKTLEEGATVEYDERETERGPCAEMVVITVAAPPRDAPYE